jgi:hypothetical protein
MRLSATKLFEQGVVATTKAYSELKPFLEYSIQNFDQLLRALKNQLTYADNFNAATVSVDLQHNRDQVIKVTSKDIFEVRLVRVFARQGVEAADHAATFLWAFNAAGELVVRAGFGSGNLQQAASVAVAGATITVVTAKPHGLTTGKRVVVDEPMGTGSLPVGEFQVSVSGPNQFQFSVSGAPTTLTGLRWGHVGITRACVLLILFN